MNPILCCAGDQWLYWRRSGLARGALGLYLLLAISCVMVTLLRMDAERATRLQHQATAQAAFTAQPNRHPHRMVHYGHYVFRAPPPLAYFDPGLDRVTGQGIFLEGHKQNTASFSPTAASAPMGRFSWLTPAQLVQILAPLVLILLGYSLLAREREGQTLITLLAQGASPLSLLGGKLLALLGAAALMLAPVAISLVAAAFEGEEAWVLLALVGAYGVYLLLWCLLITLACIWVSQGAAVLLLTLVLWICLTVLAPVLAVEVAKARLQAPGKIAMDLQASINHEEDDGHSIGPEAQQQLQQELLARYQVSRLEDVPVNMRGLVAQRAEERLTHTLNQYANQLRDGESQQSRMLAQAAWLAPVLAISNASRALAATDLWHFHGFLTGAEQVRYDFVQALNTLHANELRYEDDKNRSRDAQAEQRTRINAEHWQLLPHYQQQPAAAADRLRRAAPSVAQLALWVVLLGAALVVSARRLQP